MKAGLCVETLKSAIMAYPRLRGGIIHSDRGTQYTSGEYRQAIEKYEIIQSMNSAGGRWHDNAKCESPWGRLKEELLYGRYDTKKMSMTEVKSLIWRYFMSYWNNRRICSANGGLPPMVKEKNVHEDCTAQIYRLFNLLSENKQNIDEKGLVRIDDLEMQVDVQNEADKVWSLINSDNINELTDIEGYRKDFYNLFGFEVDGVDYEKDIDIDVRIEGVE